MSLKHPSDKPDAARPESVEPVTLSDRVNAVINPTADPSPDAASQANGLTDELAHESADDAGETDDTGKAAGANAQSSETIGIFGARKDTFSARYHLTRRGKLRRLAQIAQIANKFDVVHGLTPVKMRLMLEALGPTFVKVGQILSMRSEILPQSFCDELSKLRAGADPMPYSTVLQVLEDEYGRPVDEIFDHIDPTPLGSASLAQVHRAKLLTGEDVAIKVQRPGVRETMAQDVSIMRTIAGIATKTMRSAQVVDLSGVVEELWDTFESETDFLIETRNLAEFKRFCERYKYMDCPKPYPELCTEHVVVMDYVEGISVSHPDELLAAGYDLKEIGTKLVDNYATQVLDEGFFHADPHPGNIMVRGGQIVLLDLGMTGRLNAKTRSVLKDMIFAVAEQDSPKLADGLLRFAGAEADPEDYPALLADLDVIVKEFGTVDLAELDIAAMLTALTQMAQRHGIEVPSTVTTVGRALVTLEGLLDEFIPDVNMIQIDLRPHRVEHVEEGFRQGRDEIAGSRKPSGAAQSACRRQRAESGVPHAHARPAARQYGDGRFAGADPPARQHGEQAYDGAYRGRPVHRLVDCVLRGHQAGDFRHSDCRFPRLRDRVHPVRLDCVRHLLQGTRFEEAVAGRLALRVACVAARSPSRLPASPCSAATQRPAPRTTPPIGRIASPSQSANKRRLASLTGSVITLPYFCPAKVRSW